MIARRRNVLIVHPLPTGRARLAARLQGRAALRAAGDLTEAYNIIEGRPAEAAIFDPAYLREPEFETMLALLRAAGCAVLIAGPTKDIPLAYRDLAVVDLTRDSAIAVIEAATATVRRMPAVKDDAGRLILIGASTGGVDAVLNVLSAFPADCPPTLLVQHTGGSFTTGLARLLNSAVKPTVREATENDRPTPGTVLIAPGSEHHLTLAPSGPLRCRLLAEGHVSGHRPSVDALFRSAVPHAKRITAALLTGMGRDGAEGLLALRRAGARTIGQDEATSVVYGMPRIAHEIGGVEQQLPLGKIGPAILAPRRGAAA